MGKHTNRVPPALKYGIYSGIGLLPTESRAKFRKFKKQRFAELNLVGRLEETSASKLFYWNGAGKTFSPTTWRSGRGPGAAQLTPSWYLKCAIEIYPCWRVSHTLRIQAPKI